MAHTADVSVEKFVELLNEDLGTEYQSIVQYTNHIATITGAEYLSILDELKVHLGQELSHAQILAEQVSFLGGEPIVTVPPVERAADSRLALKPTCASRATSSSATASASPRPTLSSWPTWPRRCAPCSSRPKSTCATSRWRSETEPATSAGSSVRMVAWRRVGAPRHRLRFG
jgi:hypothetical protein